MQSSSGAPVTLLVLMLAATVLQLVGCTPLLTEDSKLPCSVLARAYGEDLPDSNVFSSNSALECQQACDRSSSSAHSCVGYTYDVVLHECHLKATIDWLQAPDGIWVSGFPSPGCTGECRVDGLAYTGL